MIAEVKKLEENLKLDFPNTAISFGREITFNLTKAAVESVNSGAVAFRFDYQDVNSEMSKQFKTDLKSVKDLVGILAVAHKTDELCVTLLHSVHKTLGYVDESAQVGTPPHAPWQYRDLTFHGIELPPPGLIASAYKSKSAEYYEVVQQINFAFHIT